MIATDRAVPGGATTAAGTAGLAPASAEHLPGADASTGLRNLLYAFQWWVFGAFAIFMWWRWLMEDVLGRARPRSGWRRRVGSTPCRVERLFVAYRVLAMVVGVLLAFCALIVFPARHFATEGSRCSSSGEQWSILWAAHGWVFIAYVVVSFLLWRQTRWSVPFALLVVVAGPDPPGHLLGRARRHPPDPRGAPRARPHPG